MLPIHVRTLGEFSLQAGSNCISNLGNRSKKVWNLLAYLIFNRDRIASQKQLIALLWPEDTDSTNPENALRITLHRLRTLLDQLWSGAGRELILYKDSGYVWNSQVSVSLDCDRFEQLCRQGQEKGEQRLARYLEALSLYRGEFLPKQAAEAWVIPMGAHFHNRFIQASLEAAALLSAQDRHPEAVQICRTAIAAEPYHEPLHQMLMRELAAAGDPRGAAAVYEALNKRLFDDFGIRPSEETRAVYRFAAHSPEDRLLAIDEILVHLQEPKGNIGAMQCDYDYFKVLCHAESRSMEHSGNVTHIALLGLSSGTDMPLTKRSLDRIMEQLGQVLRQNLRRGDTISRCSTSQYILMLPNSSYENSDMVCRRLIAAFHRVHPHVTAKLHYLVHPLSPSMSIP